jgi:periodic tryptophan protein 1
MLMIGWFVFVVLCCGFARSEILEHHPAMGAFSNIKGLSFYRDNNDDPYITLKDVRYSSSHLVSHTTDTIAHLPLNSRLFPVHAGSRRRQL